MRTLARALLLVALLAGCQKSPPQPSAAPKKITVAYTYQPQGALIHVAQAKGYFAEEGLDVTPLLHTYGKAALQSVLDNKADFATVAETPLMFSILKGERIFVIANVETSSTNNAIVARKDAGIAVPHDIRGKRVGFTPGTTSDFFLDVWLNANGLSRSEIRPVALNPEDMMAAVIAKSVDAVSAWNYPLTMIQNNLGDSGLVFYDREIYTETFNIAAQQAFVQQNPETVRHFLRALVKAENLALNRPAEAQAILASATDVEPGLVRQVWNAIGYRVALDQTLLITLEDETRWAIRNKLTDQTAMPDYASYIHLDALKAVKPKSITLIP